MKNPSSNYMGHLPYERYSEYLEDLFAAMDVYLLSVVRLWSGRDDVSPAKDGSEAARRASACAAEAFLERRLLERGLSVDQSAGDWERLLNDRRKITRELGRVIPLEALLERIGGDAFVRNVWTLSAMLKLQRGYAPVAEFLYARSGLELPVVSGERLWALTPELCVRLFIYPRGRIEETPQQRTVQEGFFAGLALPTADMSVVCGTDLDIYRRVQHYIPCLCSLFPGLAGEEQAGTCPLICDARLLDLFLNEDRYLPLQTTQFHFADDCKTMLFRQQQQELLERLMDSEQPPVVLVWGGRGAGKKLLLKHLARNRRQDLLFFSLSAGIGTLAELDEELVRLRYALRDCMLEDKLLAVTGMESLERTLANRLGQWLLSNACDCLDGVFMISETESYSDEIHCAVAVELPPLNTLQRIEVWKYYLQDQTLAPDTALESLANTFVITPGQVAEAIRHSALMDQGQQGLTSEILYRACYIQLDHRLAEKSTRVKTSFGWEDLKLAPEDKAVLYDVCSCVKHRHTVLDEWNFGKIIPYGGGITVLFSGPPGTGKTMAAQVIANELHMELYKIDLSQVIDKYVGETEKNIRQIFVQAQKSNSILFFDEADAIFNKRLEASDANERFANIESSLLLQCIEEYQGITILATNNFSAIDSAFVRRFKYYLLFKEPDEQVRYEIWQSVIPKEAPLSAEVDLRELAHIFAFTGAVIKNVVLAAAYLAADRRGEPTEITLVDLLKAIRREMAKNNLILTKEKMGSLSYLYEDMMAGQS